MPTPGKKSGGWKDSWYSENTEVGRKEDPESYQKADVYEG